MEHQHSEMVIIQVAWQNHLINFSVGNGRNKVAEVLEYIKFQSWGICVISFGVGILHDIDKMHKTCLLGNKVSYQSYIISFLVIFLYTSIPYLRSGAGGHGN